MKIAISDLEERNFHAAISGKSAMILFYTDWCPMCPQVREMLEDIEREIAGGVHYFQVDFDKCDELIEELDLVGIPTVAAMEGGEVSAVLPGFRDKSEYESLAEYMAKRVSILSEVSND